jgi:RNA polymerase sigma-70 factor (ECF subfamily)
MERQGHERIGEFIRLFTSHEVRLRAFAMSLVPHYADAEEVLQQANLVLWQKFDQFRPGSDFFAWAGRVVYLEAKDFRRKQARDKLRFGDDFYDALAAQVEAPGFSDELAERERLLGECMARLKPDQRQILTLRYEQGNRVDRVATAVGRSTEAVYIALSRIRKLLQDCVSRKLGTHGA